MVQSQVNKFLERLSVNDEIKCASFYNDDDDDVPSSTQVQMLARAQTESRPRPE